MIFPSPHGMEAAAGRRRARAEALEGIQAKGGRIGDDVVPRGIRPDPINPLAHDPLQPHSARRPVDRRPVLAGHKPGQRDAIACAP
jgi:hypothetical protein